MYQMFRNLHCYRRAMLSRTKATVQLYSSSSRRDVARAAQTYGGHLREENEEKVGFRQISLETCIKAIGKAGDTALSAALHERYTNLAPVHALIEEWEPHKPIEQE